MPAAKFNLNTAKSGRYMVRRLTIGELPAQLLSVKRECRAYRRALEDEVTRVYGEVDVVTAHEIDLACQGQMHVGICRWILRNRWEKMTATDVMNCSREMLKAKEARNKAVHALALHREPNYIDALYADPDPQNEEEEDDE